MAGGIVVVFFLLIIILIGVANFTWRVGRGDDLLEQWAQSHGMRIVNRERRTFATGPFFFRKGKGQDVYYVTVEDAGNRMRSGYVRVGGMFLGLLSDQVDVVWDS